MALAEYYNRLFEDVDESIVAALERVSTLRTLGPHSYLFDQYSEARGVYVLESGVIMIERSSAAGRRQILGFSYPGDFVGLTHNDFFEYSVQSLTQSEVREFPIAEFIRLSDSSPELSRTSIVLAAASFLTRSIRSSHWGRRRRTNDSATCCSKFAIAKLARTR